MQIFSVQLTKLLMLWSVILANQTFRCSVLPVECSWRNQCVEKWKTLLSSSPQTRNPHLEGRGSRKGSALDQEQWEFVRSEESKGQFRQTFPTGKELRTFKEFSVVPVGCLDLLRADLYPESRGDRRTIPLIPSQVLG